MKTKVRRKVSWSAYGFLSPALIGITILSIAPIFYTIYIAFTNFDANHFLSYQFVGLKNFKELLNPNDPLSTLFIPTFIWSLVFAIIATLLNYFVGLFLAMLLNNKNMKESAVYRSILIIPWAVPGLISLLVWQGLLNTDYGQINALLHTFGIGKIPWLTDPNWARVSTIMVNLWVSFPYMMLVCLGALQAISQELYEASAIDGATWTKQFRYITLPSVWKISLPLIIPSFAFNFNNFNAVYLLTGGGPARSTNQFVGYTDNLSSAAYKLALTFQKYDLSSAISIILFILVAAITLVNMKYTKAFEEVDD